MKTRLIKLWNNLRSSYWFVPGLLALCAAILSIGMIYIDFGISPDFLVSIDLFQPSSARMVLSTIAAAAITVASVIFSITIVVLNIASNQFGPRLLRNFMQHGGTQLVLGFFIATFIYCLIAITAIRDERTPQFSVLIGIVLGIIAFFQLIYFINHVIKFIQVPKILDDVYDKLVNSIRNNFPENDADEERETPAVEIDHIESMLVKTGIPILSSQSGYLQMIDREGLISVAVKQNLVIKLLCRPGHFITAGAPVALIKSPEEVDEKTEKRICNSLLVGSERIIA